MIIDASVSRNGYYGCGCGCGMSSYPAGMAANASVPMCAAYPSCAAYPGCHPCPSVPVNTGSAITNQQTTAVPAVAVGASVPFDSTSRVFGNDLAYDSTNNAIIINTAGTYYFAWNVLAEPAEAATDVLFTLRTLDGSIVLAYSGADITTAEEGSVLVSGNTVAALPAGARVVLVNTGTTAVALPEAGTAPQAFVAEMTVVRIA